MLMGGLFGLIGDNGTENKCSYLDPLAEYLSCLNNEFDTCLSFQVEQPCFLKEMLK